MFPILSEKIKSTNFPVNSGNSDEVVSATPLDLVSFSEDQGRCSDAWFKLKVLESL